jgi:hypothetical protein
VSEDIFPPAASGVSVQTKTFTASGSFTQPAGYSWLEGEIQAAGGGSTSSNTGGGGEWVGFSVPCPAGTTVTVTIGAANVGATGSDSTVAISGEYTAITAKGGVTGNPGSGGGRKGPAGVSNAVGADAVIEGLTSISGAAPGGNTGTNNGGACEQWPGGTGGLNHGGGGAAKSGPGGPGAVASTTPSQGFGGGAGANSAGSSAGAPGFVRLTPKI